MKHLSVVLVDDDALVLSGLRRVLQAAQVNVRATQSAAAALALLEEQPSQIVISDWKMPGMDGLAFLAEVQRRYPHARCALHTGEPPEATSGLRWRVLRKPCKVQELLAFLSELQQALPL